ncbi:ATP-binding protein [Lacisediminimonas sp.]|uniref:ATP-binding protein n=1 Tax=Lacisediminimonas sp. TaxID=3060582 RepID=UPI0027278280|nr:ATP-binding protein [Lacisediminimonas sp.]MDO8299528.1 ATP-binding protein [Lacisediminimonas sp.]
MMSFLRSMAGRVFLILLLGVLASAALTWWLAFSERQRAVAELRDARATELIEQSVLTLDALPAAQRPRHLERARRFGVRYELVSALDASERAGATPGPLSRLLAQRLGSDFLVTPLKLAPEACPLPRMRPSPENRMMAWQKPPPAPNNGCEGVAVQLRDGQFLRAAILPPRNSSPPLPTDLPLYLALFLFCIAALVFAVTRMTMLPLRQLANAARALGDDVHRPPLPLQGATEIRQATTAFNAMQARIRQQIQQRTEMLAAITHDLQTPLTRLRLRLEKVSDAALREKLIEDLAATQAMVKEGLALARSMDNSEPMQTLDLDSLLDSVCADAADAGEDVQLEGQSRMSVQARPTALRRCLTNLVDNAVKYGGYARVQVQPQGSSEVLIRVLDGGPGIPPDQQAQVFEPFYRMENSRSRESGGTGLGLTIARNIIEQHGGSISLANRPEGGLALTLMLPSALSNSPS